MSWTKPSEITSILSWRNIVSLVYLLDEMNTRKKTMEGDDGKAQGFKRGLEADKILGSADDNGELMYLMQWWVTRPAVRCNGIFVDKYNSQKIECKMITYKRRVADKQGYLICVGKGQMRSTWYLPKKLTPNVPRSLSDFMKTE